MKQLGGWRDAAAGGRGRPRPRPASQRAVQSPLARSAGRIFAAQGGRLNYDRKGRCERWQDR
jgi:hypothetical protein